MSPNVIIYNYMEIETKHFKILLETEAENLEKELQGIGRKNPENPSDWEATEKIEVDAADNEEVADSMEEFGNNTAILEQLEKRLSEVKIALANIEAGKYGICKVCGKQIENDRLEANPAAETCKLHM